MNKFSIWLVFVFIVFGMMIGARLQQMHDESKPVTLIEVSSDRDTTEIVLPKDSLHRVECKTSYVVIK